MKGRSILLALSGSQQSKYAAEVCFRLAAQLGASVTAQHIIDTHSAWEFLGHEKPGFLESSSYLSTYQNLCNSLFQLGEDLAAAYKAEAINRGLDPHCLIDEGNPILEICRRSLTHDLVVMGHRPSGESRDNPRSQFLRLSIAESLAHDLQRPLLVVQDDSSHWKSLTIMISIEHINELFINSCLDMAAALQLKPALVCLAGGPNVETPEHFVRDVRAANPRLSKVPVAVTQGANEDLVTEVDCWDFPDGDMVWDVWENTLMVIPTRELNGQRVTVVGSSASLFVRYLTLPSIMLWPEEHRFSLTDTSKGALTGRTK